MLAVHVGAGNIGRGFIGALLYQSGYHTIFVDVNGRVIDEINEKKQYQVILAGEQKETLNIENISGMNSLMEADKVVQAIAEADILTTAVGPNVLGLISELIAKGLLERLRVNPTTMNLIACENMVGASDVLKEKVYEHVTEEERVLLEQLVGFPNAAVDRIVPNQVMDDRLTVLVEPYFEWIVEKPAFKGPIPDIKGIRYVDDLKPYIERKLFTVNTGHAVPAYMGHLFGYTTIYEAMNDKRIVDILEGALQESGEAIIRNYHFDRDTHETYQKTIINRFKNPYISDEVIRVGRGPIRKLGPNDRLIRPAKMYMELTGKPPVMLAKVIAAALLFFHEQDKEAVELRKMISTLGYEEALRNISGLETGHMLLSTVMQSLHEMTAKIE